MSNKHISLAKLLQFQEALLAKNEVQRIEKHLNNCSICKEIFKGLKIDPKDDALSETETDFIWERISYGINKQNNLAKQAKISITPKKFFLIAASICLILFSCLFIFKQTTNWQESHIILCQSQKPVAIKFAGNKIKINKGYIVHAKTIFTTEKNNYADIKLAENSGIRIMDSSELSVKKISQYKKQKKIDMYLKKGLAVARLDKKLSSTTFSLQTPHGLFKVIGTRFALQTTKNMTTLYLFEGKIKIKNNVNQLAEAVSITKTDGNKITLLKTDTSDSHFSSLEKLSRNITFITPKTENLKIIKPKITKKANPAQTFKEKLLLNDGSNITGTILRQEKDKLSIKTSYGIMNFKKTDIKKIIYIK